MRALAATCLALAVMATGCVQGGPVDGWGTVEAGVVERLDDGEWVAVTRADPGAVLRAAEDAALRLDGSVVRLRRGTQITLADAAIELARGDVLVEGRDVALAAEGTSVRGTGAYRLEGGTTPRVAVYSGGAQVTRPGEQQRLNALRELDLASRRFDGTDQPVAYDADDPLDRRVLGQAIAFDDQVGNLVVGIDATYGRLPQPPSFYTAFVSVAEDDVVPLVQSAPTVGADGRVGPPADALVGLFLARAAAEAGDGDLLAAADRIRALRDEGARWGLVATALGVTGVDFAGIVDRAVERADGLGVAPAPAPAAAAPGPGAAAPSGGQPPAAGDPAPPPAPPADDPPAPAPPEPAPQGPVGSVLDQVLDLVDGLGQVDLGLGG